MSNLFKIKTIHDLGATLMGLGVAISTALLTIDWANFNVIKEWPKLVLSGIIATGGYFSTIKKTPSLNDQQN